MTENYKTICGHRDKWGCSVINPKTKRKFKLCRGLNCNTHTKKSVKAVKAKRPLAPHVWMDEEYNDE